MTGSMDVLPEGVTDEAPPSTGPGPWRRELRAILLSPPGVLLLALLAIAILAPVIAPHDPLVPRPTEKLLPPSAEFWFGTDSFGMDVFSRVIYATRVDLTVALGSVLTGMAIGVPVGAMAGYVGGWVDNSLMRVSEMVQAFPPIMFALLVFAAAGNNIPTLVLLIAFFNVPVYVRMVRSVILPLRDADFVYAARAVGHGRLSLVARHLLPNSLVPVFAQFAISCGFAIQLVAALSFLGLGVRFPDPEWGSMINIGADHIVFGQWWPSVFPGIAVFLAAFALTGLGHRLRRRALREAK